jgi:dTDP-4-dehydrorhamnose reductase
MRLYPWHGNCQEFGVGGRKLLVTGATGTLGRAFARICEHRGLPFCVTSRAELNLADPASISAAIAHYRPWAVINAAGYVRVADAEDEPEACLAANATGAEFLAVACAASGIPLVTFSSDLVFDGKKGGAYHEEDPTCPTCVYGSSKASAEQRVLAAADQALIVRTSAFFGPWDRYNFAWATLAALARGEAVRASRDVVVSPTYVPDLCHATLDLLIDGEQGIWHLANDGAVSWHEFARRLAEGAGYDPALVLPVKGVAGNTTLGSSRGMPMRPLDQSIDAFLREIGQHAEALAAEQVAAE